MKLIEIKDEEFLYRGFLFKLETIDNKVKLKFIRKWDGKKKREFHPPTKEEVMTYFFDKGYESFSGIKAWEYYNELGWKDKNGKQVLNWRSKMIMWFSEDIKRKEKTEDAKPQLIL